jgi:prepilin-type processing-associated H-X9-DG protein
VSELTRGHSNRDQQAGAGFSQVDLLAVVVVLLLLALLLTPALARTRLTDQAFQCRNNLRQLLQAWRMYADDNHGTLAPNQEGPGAESSPSWVNGTENWTADNSDNTNLLLLANALLGPYVGRQTALYKCPADIFLCQEGGQKLPRVRSVSMNAFVEGDAYQGYKSNPHGSFWYPTYRGYMKVSDVIQPSPSDLLVFADEHPDSINDGWLITNVENPRLWEDLPGSYHGNACGMSFADGHSTTHKWFNASTAQPITQVQRSNFSIAYGSQDLQWMWQHVTALLPPVQQ